MSATMKLFGKRVRQLRLEKGYSVVQLGGLVGLNEQTLWSIESGRYSTSFNSLVNIANALKVNEYDLFVWQGTNPLFDLINLLRKAPLAKVVELKGVLEKMLGPEALQEAEESLRASQK